MKHLHVRVDDRLIHGQVLVGCCGPLNIQRLVLARDAVAADAFQAEIYRAAVPPEIELHLVSVPESAALLRRLGSEGDDRATLLVVEGPLDLRRLHRARPLHAATLGGLHQSERRTRELVRGMFVGGEDLDALAELVADGVRLTVQTVPGTAEHVVTAERLRRARGS